MFQITSFCACHIVYKHQFGDISKTEPKTVALIVTFSYYFMKDRFTSKKARLYATPFSSRSVARRSAGKTPPAAPRSPRSGGKLRSPGHLSPSRAKQLPPGEYRSPCQSQRSRQSRRPRRYPGVGVSDRAPHPRPAFPGAPSPATALNSAQGRSPAGGASK